MKEMLPKIIVILGICIIFIICAFLFVQLYFSIKLENKLKKFTVNVDENNTISFVDRLMIFFLKIIKKISKLNSKSVILKKYSVRLSKYLIYNKSNNLSSIDYVSIKILYMIFIDILYVIMSILKGVKTNLSLFIILSFVSFFMIDIILIIVYKKKRNTIEAGLLQAIVIMNSAFKSGKNIWQAINIVKTSTESPIKEEFEIISKDIDYGLDLLTVFERFYNRVKVEEVKYILSSYYQGTKYNPYSAVAGKTAGMYRTIGIARTGFMSINQIRPYVSNEIKAVEWICFGPNPFNSVLPFYTNTLKMHKYVSGTTLEVSTDSFYWNSRLIGALTVPCYAANIQNVERYQKMIAATSTAILNEYDAKMMEKNDYSLIDEANQKIADNAKAIVIDTLNKVLYVASTQMKCNFNRADN